MADSLSSQLEPLAAAGAASGQPGVNGVPQVDKFSKRRGVRIEGFKRIFLLEEQSG